MAVNSRKTSKTVVLSIRMTPREKYCLDLIAREEKRSSPAILVEEAIKSLIDAHAMSQRNRTADTIEINGKTKDVEILGDSLLDVLWSPNPGKRLFNLKEYAPNLMSDEDLCIYKKLVGEKIFWTIGENKRPHFWLMKKAWSLLEEYAEEALDNPEADLDIKKVQQMLDEIDEDAES